ncbi:exported hypothetical protein [Rhodospirillaceae bacterium LM-1]|nr:exported hypothetical protein [Rhodospirillaceae bacterium LM-1]
MILRTWARGALFMVLLFVATFYPPFPVSAQPSFDCVKASSKIEKLICANADLAALDMRMAESFKRKHSALLEKNDLEARVFMSAQADWLVFRNKECSQAAPVFSDQLSCLNRVYKERITFFENRSVPRTKEFSPSIGGQYAAYCLDNSFSIRPLPTNSMFESNTPSPYTFDCTLRDGTEIRLRWGTDQAMPYGECGGDAGEFFSLWVNWKHLASRQYLKGGRCMGESVTGVLATDRFVKVCRYIGKDENGIDKTDGGGYGPNSRGDRFGMAKWAFKRVCTDVAIGDQPKDKFEYPDNPSSKPIVGSLITKSVVPSKLCHLMNPDGAEEPVIPASAERISWIPWKKTEYCGSTGRAHFDFSNAGVQQDVYNWNLCTHAQDGDTYLALPKDAPEPDVQIGEYDGDRRPTPVNGVMWDLGYAHGEVFRLDGKTYVLSTPVNDDLNPQLLMPKGDGKMTKACEWEVVRPHY